MQRDRHKGRRGLVTTVPELPGDGEDVRTGHRDALVPSGGSGEGLDAAVDGGAIILCPHLLLWSHQPLQHPLPHPPLL